MPEPKGSSDNHAGASILVVDDSDAIRKVVCAMLTQNGYTCLEACNGAEALSFLRTGAKIHLVLTDVAMPRMGGAELAAYLVREYPSLPILFMSGYTDNPMVRAIEQTPIFLPKPFTASALTTTVRRALEQPWSGLPGWCFGSCSL
ncbi:MAG TPA: response regulator [Bryobacteraceae bacterium]|nr:response regulator [Bryobacteraceae bacterium]